MKNISSPQKGSAALITFLMFMAISLAILAAFYQPVVQSARVASSAYDSKESYYIAEALVEDVIYRLNNSMSVDSVESLQIDDYDASATITDVGDTKEILVTGTSGNVVRDIQAEISTEAGVSFSYGLQVGNGGLTMSNEATITGNVYSNGNISGSGAATITGSAIAGMVTPLTAEVSNGTSTPVAGIDLGRTGTALTEISQSFTVSTSTPVLRFSFNLKKNGAPANLTLKVMTNSSGSPSSTQIGSTVTISAASITSNYGWVDVYMSSALNLTPGTTYWVKVISSATNATNYYTLGVNDGVYTSGQLKTKTSSGSWTLPSPSSQDAYFAVYNGSPSSISGMSSIGGTARALNVTGSTVTGTIYCQTGSGNNKACDTSQAPPVALGMAVSEANIDEWTEMASAGTSRGSWSISGTTATSTTGALVINGSLNLSNNAILTLNGPLYVTGSINISNDSVIRLGSSYGSSSGFIIVGGGVNTSNNANFQGSGFSNSHIMIATKNGNISISNQGGSVVLVTLNGTITFSNFATAKAAVGYRMIMSNHTTLNYETGLADISFTSGPSGTWGIDSWQEVE